MTDQKNLGLIDYLNVLVRWRKAIILNFFGICILTALVSLTLPKWYRAYTTILPPSDGADVLNISSFLSDLPAIGGFTLPNVNPQGLIFSAILQSRTVLDSVIAKFDLMNVYESESMEKTREALAGHMDVSLNDDGTLTLSVEASTSYLSFGEDDQPTKTLAKDMANYFIALLDSVNKRLRSERARNNRIFIESRYERNLEELAFAETSLKDFQFRHNAVALPQQTEATIKVLAELKGQIVAKEVELEVLKEYVDPSHTSLQRGLKELREMQDKYDEFILSRRGSSKGEDLFLPFEDLPELSLKYARLYREVLIQQKIQEFLLPQYEQARIQEARDTPTVQVLDPAVAPEHKERPKRAFIVIFAGFASIFLTMIASYLVVYLENIRTQDPRKFEQIKEISSSFRIKKLLK